MPGCRGRWRFFFFYGLPRSTDAEMTVLSTRYHNNTSIREAVIIFLLPIHYAAGAYDKEWVNHTFGDVVEIIITIHAAVWNNIKNVRSTSNVRIYYYGCVVMPLYYVFALTF